MSEIEQIFDALEEHYGEQVASWPTDPPSFLLWWQCGYPPSELACAKGWHALQQKTEPRPANVLAASDAILAEAMAAGGMVPELRAARLKEVAALLEQTELKGSPEECRKQLVRFPGIGMPGADRILLFGGLASVPAVPSAHPQVLVRIRKGREAKSYSLNYRTAQRTLEAETPADFAVRKRAYLLLKRHGEDLCRRTTPRCSNCPVRLGCAFAAEGIGPPTGR